MGVERGQTVSELGEIALVERIRAQLERAPASEVWSGDDAAVVGVSGGQVLYAIDTLVEDVDFDLGFSSGSDIGFKSVAVNVSDIAAMGGRPSHALAALVLPPATSVAFVDDIVVGLNEAGRTWNVHLVGGDISAGSEISISIALLGAPVAAPVLRSGARVGDAICVTGRLGGAAGGLAALRAGRDLADMIERLAHCHLRPRARLEEAVAIASLPPSAMIDVSDGLAVDLWRLMEASGTGCDVDDMAVPADPDLDAIADLVDPLEAALIGGDDYELLITIDPSRFEEAHARVSGLRTELARIGTVTAGERSIGDRSLDELRSRAWEHLRGR